MRKYLKLVATALCLSTLLVQPLRADDQQNRPDFSKMQIARAERQLSLKGDSAKQFEKVYTEYLNNLRELRRKQNYGRNAEEMGRMADAFGLNDPNFRQQLDKARQQLPTEDDMKQLRKNMKEQLSNCPDSTIRSLLMGMMDRDSCPTRDQRIDRFMKEWRNDDHPGKGPDMQDMMKQWRKIDPRTEEQIDKQLQEDFDNSQKLLDLRKDYYKKLRKVLLPSQIEELYNLERRTGNQFLQEQMRRQQGNRGCNNDRNGQGRKDGHKNRKGDKRFND